MTLKNGFHLLFYSKYNHQEEGYILIVYSCLISLALILFTGGYISFQENQIRQLERGIRSTKAFYIAQAGLQKIAEDKDLTEGSFAEGQYKKIATEDPSRLRVTGEFKGVTRTLEATINHSDFQSAVYSLNEPSFCRRAGTIDGENHYAIQSAGAIQTESFENVPIIFKSSLSKAILPNSPRQDYRPIENRLKNEKENLKFITQNDNEQITKHSPGKPPPITIKGGAYRYWMDAAGILWQAELTVNGQLALPKGTYYLTKLTLSENSVLTGKDGPVTIFCASNVTVGEGAKIKGYGDRPKNFSLRMCSTGSSIPTITIEQNCQFRGTVLAPGCRFIFHAGLDFVGSILVENFNFECGVGPGNTWSIKFDEALAGGSSLLTNWRELT